MNVKIHSFEEGRETGSTTLSDELFGQQVNEHLLWLAVKRYLGNQRQGTAAVKNKALVSGGGKKPFKQKGTGNARQGSNTSPLMPGGGRAFGPKPRSHRTDMPKQQRHTALVSALSLRAGESAVSVIEDIVVDGAPKTARVAGVITKIGLGGKKTLLVVGQQNEAVWKSVRNLRDVTTTLAHQLNPYDLLDCEQLLLTQDGLARVKEVFSK